jgi:hypothetical protein
MNKEQAASLRKAFAANQIGTLPKGGVRLEYVGHAATTDRLLQVDPDWTWAPVAHDERGLPRLDEHGGLWIRLTVCGVTRLGYGDAAGKKGPNSVKEAIGDAIRNAAMRFGVALDLWAKEDLQAVEPAAKKSPRSAPSPAAAAQKPEPTPGSAPPSGDSELKLPPQGAISAEQVKRLWTIARRELELGDEAVKAVVVAVTGQESTKAIPTAHYDKVLEELRLAAAAAKT